MKRFALLSAVLCIGINHHVLAGSYLSQTLDDHVQLKWMYDDSTITIKLTVESTGWIGIGFSPGDDMAGADLIVAGVRYGKEYVLDCYARKNGPPKVDESQDVSILEYKQEDGYTKVVLKRKFVTSDPNDMRIVAGEMNVIWAYGKWDIRKSPGWSNYHLLNRGHMMIELLPDRRPDEYEYSGMTSLGNAVSVYWYHDLKNIFFKVKAPTDGWVGLGLSPSGTMAGADLMLAGFKKGECYVYDTHAERNGYPRVDDSQDVEIERCTQKDGETEVLLKRPVATGDKDDLALQAGEMKVIWAYGMFNIYGAPWHTNYHFGKRGMRLIEFVPKYDDDDDNEEITPSNYPNSAYLGEDVLLEWMFNDTTIVFQLTAPTTGWIGVGVSPKGTMVGADLMIVGEANGTAYAVDANAARNGVPSVDATQDVTAISSTQTSTTTTAKFSRLLDTGDRADDRKIRDANSYVIWAFGTSDVTNPPTYDLYHGGNRGAKELNLLAGTSGMI